MAGITNIRTVAISLNKASPFVKNDAKEAINGTFLSMLFKTVSYVSGMSSLFISEPLTLQIDNLSSLEKSSPEAVLRSNFSRFV